MLRKLILPLLLALSGCVSAPATEVATRQVSLPRNLPPMKAFSGTAILAPVASNARIAADFLDLSFQLESGRTLPVLSRFEGPITLRVIGKAPGHLSTDLNRLLARLRREAGIDITLVQAHQPASITIDVITRRKLQSQVPHAACFVAANASGWDEFKRLRGTPKADWTLLTTRKQMAVFLPGDVSPQELRDCLHEEVAQALGPVNDLYRLNNSVFNDDNFHTVLTGFDMLILRAFYAPELHSGMTRDQVAARLPALLSRLNPSGGVGTPLALPQTPQIWKGAIQSALTHNAPGSSRRAAAQQAVSVARQNGWHDTRLAFSLFALGRLSLGRDSATALASFREAEEIYRSLPGTGLQAAHMGVQLAAHALSAGQAETAIDIVNSHLPPVMRAENAALLSILLMIKAEALDLSGQRAEAQMVRLDSLGWARYGFGSDAEVGERLGEIAAISPDRRG